MADPARTNRNRPIIAPIVLILPILLASSMIYGLGGDTLRVSYIDVGQGDAIWIHASDGTDILIDGGPSKAGPTVVAHLQARSVDSIDVMVVSHPHEDHVAGLTDVLQSAITVDAVLYNGQVAMMTPWAEFVDAMQTRQLTPTPAQEVPALYKDHSWRGNEMSSLRWRDRTHFGFRCSC